MRPYKTTRNNRIVIWMELCTLAVIMIWFPFAYKWNTFADSVYFSQWNFSLIFIMLTISAVLMLFHHVWRAGIEKEEFPVDNVPLGAVKAKGKGKAKMMSVVRRGQKVAPGDKLKGHKKKKRRVLEQEGGESEPDEMALADDPDLAAAMSNSDEGEDSEEEKQVNRDDNEYPIVSADVNLAQGEIENRPPPPEEAEKMRAAEALDDANTGASFYNRTGQQDPFGLPQNPPEPRRGKYKQI